MFFKSVFLVIQQLNCTDLKWEMEKTGVVFSVIDALLVFVNILSFIFYYIFLF